MTDSTSLYREGRMLLWAGDVSGAREKLLQSFGIQAHCKTALLLADCATKLGDAEAAHRFIREAYRLQSNNNEAATRLAELLHAGGEVIQARLVVNEILKRCPIYGPALKLQQQLTNNSD